MTGVVSETEKAGETRQVSTGKTNVSEPLMKCRKGIDAIETGRSGWPGMKPEGCLLTARVVAGMKAA